MKRPFRKVALIHFDEVYFLQNRLRALSWKEFDLRSFKGVRYRCAMDTLSVLEGLLKDIPKGAVVFTGSGDYHYISYLLLKRLDRPFSLVLFDNHHDAYQPQEDWITCDSWVVRACSIPTLRKVYLIGTGQSVSSKLPSKLEVIPTCALDNIEKLVKKMDHHIYISIDKDVLSPVEVRTNWDQGTLTLKQLTGLLKVFVLRKTLLGMDICGESRVEWRHLLGMDNSHMLNQRVNLEVINALCSIPQSRTA